jgi:hypothetical protein
MLTGQPLLLVFAALLAPAGIWFAALGVRRYAAMRRISPREHAKALTSLQAFRQTMIGACLLMMALALSFEILWLGVLAAVIFGEELFESSMAIYAMKYGSKLNVRL